MDIEVGKRYTGSVGVFMKFWGGILVDVLKLTSRTVHVRIVHNGEERKFTVKEFSELFRVFDRDEYVEEKMRYRVYRVWPKEFVRALKGDMLRVLNDAALEYLNKSMLVEELEKECKAK